MLLKERVGPLRPHLSGFYFDSEYVEELTMQQVKEMSHPWGDIPSSLGSPKTGSNAQLNSSVREMVPWLSSTTSAIKPNEYE